MAKLIFAAAITLLLSALLVDAATTSATATAGKVADTDCTEDTEDTVCTADNSDCDTRTSKCKCKTNYELADEDTTCKLSAGQICADDDECASDDCFGSTENTSGLCNGAPVAVTASIVLMFFTFLTSRFF
ncbi:uncharacterized protein [Littorina saxatilis]|uniref:uncharacterized protein n=1 Tax=Littorina saxatilis TaxID=31220 RepID=UPI0038B63F2B